MAKRKKRVGLPRVTVMAYNRRDLLAFVEAVAKLEHIAADLLTVAQQLPKPKPKKLPEVTASAPIAATVDPPARP